MDMLYAICYIARMARGPSGRFVIILEPELKVELYAALSADGTNLREWFRSQVNAYLVNRRQPELPGLFPGQLPRQSSGEADRLT